MYWINLNTESALIKILNCRNKQIFQVHVIRTDKTVQNSNEVRTACIKKSRPTVEETNHYVDKWGRIGSTASSKLHADNGALKTVIR
jgi:hypothetical protein